MYTISDIKNIVMLFKTLDKKKQERFKNISLFEKHTHIVNRNEELALNL